MNTLETSAIVFICIFGGALLGFWLRAVLPEDHLSPTSRDLVKLGMGTIATMTALVLGLLVASAKNNYDAQSRELTEMSAKIIVLDRVLSHYGPEAKEARDLLQVVVTRLIERTWPASKAGRTMAEPSATRSEVLYDKIQELVPTNDTQRSLQTRALNIAVDIGQMRWLMIEQGYSLASLPLLVVLIFSLTITFISFGLHAAPNGTVLATFFLSALSVSGVIFLILEMYTPLGGFIQISSAPLRAALAYLGQ
jgi:hypothetical protein